MRFWLSCLILAIVPITAGAGAWPRDKDSVFLSFSSVLSTPTGVLGRDLQVYSSLYAEYGLSRDLTLGLDAGKGQGGDYSATVFLRMPLLRRAERHRFAFKAGLGLAEDDTLVNLGASWGRGMETRYGHGWVSLDTDLVYHTRAGTFAGKADLTLGIKPGERTKLMLQLQIGDYPGSGPFVRLAPSVARKFGSRTYVVLGAKIGVVGDDRAGLKLGTWLEF